MAKAMYLIPRNHASEARNREKPAPVRKGRLFVTPGSQTIIAPFEHLRPYSFASLPLSRFALGLILLFYVSSRFLSFGNNAVLLPGFSPASFNPFTASTFVSVAKSYFDSRL